MFGILIVEDLIAILLITILTAVSAGRAAVGRSAIDDVGRLAAFLVAADGRRPADRAAADARRSCGSTARRRRWSPASASLRRSRCSPPTFGYSVALGAFIAGSLVAESGVEKTVEHLVQPVRDMFAAIFFVSVGMLIDPMQIARALARWCWCFAGDRRRRQDCWR